MQQPEPKISKPKLLELSEEERYVNIPNISSSERGPQVLIFGGCSTDHCARLTDASAASWRINLDGSNNSWLQEEMPAPRVMPWSCLLPDGTVFVMGGAENGEGWRPDGFWLPCYGCQHCSAGAGSSCCLLWLVLLVHARLLHGLC